MTSPSDPLSHPASPVSVPSRKYQRVLDQLERDIHAGNYAVGAKLPSEADLVRRLGVSRITVGRAVRELARRGLIERRAGSGSYVRRPETVTTAPPAGRGQLFGLLIPDLGETEIFEPICQGMAGAPGVGSRHALVWGQVTRDPAAKEQAGWELCRQYVARGVDGVFFAPYERTPASREINRRILQTLEEAHIPVVLLDRDVLPYPERSRHDLVGIDNRRAGFLATDHLLRQGCRRPGFLAFPDTAATVDARVAGYREALRYGGTAATAGTDDAGVNDDRRTATEHPDVARLDPADAEAVQRWLDTSHPDGVVCANDRTAGQLMHTLLGLGHRIPQDLRLVGMDDVGYASLLPVPLTTVHQPCREIGIAAMSAMLERTAAPSPRAVAAGAAAASPTTPLLARDILLRCDLVVRASCGALPAPSRRRG